MSQHFKSGNQGAWGASHAADFYFWRNETVLLDYSSPFSVDVQNDDTVYDLKKAVMRENSHALAGLDANQLTIRKVSNFFQDCVVTPYKVLIEITKDLENEVSRYPLVDKDIRSDWWFAFLIVSKVTSMSSCTPHLLVSTWGINNQWACWFLSPLRIHYPRGLLTLWWPRFLLSFRAGEARPRGERRRDAIPNQAYEAWSWEGVAVLHG